MALALAETAALPMRSIISAAVVVALVAGGPRVAGAQTRAAELWPSAMTAPPITSSTAAEEWSSLAHEQYAASRYRESIASFERALQLRVGRPETAALHIARAYARLGNRKQAMRWLSHSVDLGYDDWRAIREDEAFAAYREDADFLALGTVRRRSPREALSVLGRVKMAVYS